jgi:hypothetical protein
VVAPSTTHFDHLRARRTDAQISRRAASSVLGIRGLYPQVLIAVGCPEPDL